ncbi:hypothetical protein MRX96_038494 [Rhipicephalus microplus]
MLFHGCVCPSTGQLSKGIIFKHDDQIFTELHSVNMVEREYGCVRLAPVRVEGDVFDAGIAGRFARMLSEVDWEWIRYRDFDFVRALEQDVDRGFEQERPLFVSSVADASVVNDGEGSSSVN